MENNGFEDIELKTVENGNIELYSNEKKTCTAKNALLSQRNILVAVAIMLLLILIFGGFYYMRISNKVEIQKEIRAALSELRATHLNGRPPPLIHQGNVIQPTIHSSTVLKTTPTISKSTAIYRKSTPDPSKPWLNMRLPKSIIPNSYDIHLIVDMVEDVYSGIVSINVSINQTTDLIIFHAVGLKILEINIKDHKDSITVPILKEFIYEPNEFYIVQTKSFLNRNETYILTIRYNAEMRTDEDMDGFYTSFYNNGKKKGKVASTFFSPISARRAIPCFDEPSFKATFTITLTHSSKYHALSNMLDQYTYTKDGMTTTKFNETLKMSTYLLCWVISDYKSLQSENKMVRAWTYSQDVEDVRLGFENGEKLLRFYEEYFEIPYPLKKLDLVPIPSFSPGAMENWGIITLRYERFILNKKTTTEYLIEVSYYLLAHELVHQWFGNLVTMEFWTDAWLKEGFANNIGAIGGHHVNKSMGAKEHALLEFMLPALELDSHSTSHPISTSVQTPSDIRGMFNMITYMKGSCLVDLIHNYLGEDDFKKGLRQYLRKYAYRNAKQDDLWESLSNESGKDVKKVMDTWTLQLGYPVISIERLNQTHIEISQQRFTLDPPGTVPPPSPFNYMWKVPIILKSPSNNSTTKRYLLEGEKAIIPASKEYSIVNPDHALFYRVYYSKSMLDWIVSTIKTNPTILTAQDRAGIIADQFSFAAANLSDIGKVLDFVSYIKNETEYCPWKVTIKQLSYISSLIVSKNMKRQFDNFISDITIGITRKLGWGLTRTMNEGNLQEVLLYFNCKSDKSFAYQYASKAYEDWIKGIKVELRPTLQQVMIDCAISVGVTDYWDFAYWKYHANVASNEYLLWSLCTTTNIRNAKRLLKWSLDDRKIAAQYTPYVIGQLAGNNHETRTLCWEFIKTNWAIFIRRYGAQVFMLSDMLSDVLGGFSTPEELNDIKTFFKHRPVGSADKVIKETIRKVEGNILWKKYNLHNLRKWLDKQQL